MLLFKLHSVYLPFQLPKSSSEGSQNGQIGVHFAVATNFASFSDNNLSFFK